MIDDYVLHKVLGSIKIDTGDILPENITLINAVIRRTSLTKDDGQFYPQLFLQELLYNESDIDSEFVTYFNNDIGLNIKNLSNIKLDNNSFDHCDPDTINHLTAWYNRYPQHKTYKKDRWRITACSMGSEKSVGFMCAKRLKQEVELFFINEK